jgi:hypothetical protein
LGATGSNGGSGGGSATIHNQITTNPQQSYYSSATYSNGNRGGYTVLDFGDENYHSRQLGAGGGGAGSQGINADTDGGGGGEGLLISITGSSLYYAAGGGGAGYQCDSYEGVDVEVVVWVGMVLMRD